MRHSSLRHPVAVLRKFLGQSQEEMATHAQCSVATIQSIESGRLAVSPTVAEAIGLSTGVSMEWLLEGDPAAPIVAYGGHPYTNETFLNAQSRKASGEPTTRGLLIDHAETLLGYQNAILLLSKIFVAAQQKRNVSLVKFKTLRALREICKELDIEEPRNLLAPLKRVSSYEAWLKKALAAHVSETIDSTTVTANANRKGSKK